MSDIHLIKRYEAEVNAKEKLLEEQIKSDKKTPILTLTAILLFFLCLIFSGFFMTKHINNTAFKISAILFSFVVFVHISKYFFPNFGISDKAVKLVVEIKNLKLKINAEKNGNNKFVSEKVQAKSFPMEKQIDNTTVILLYILSFFIPLAGFIVGASYASKEEEHYKHVGKTCLIYSVMNVFLGFIIIALIFV